MTDDTHDTHDTHDDLERRLTDALDSAAGAQRDTSPPSFSWQSPATAGRSRGIPRRAVYAASGLVAAAVAAAVLATTLTGSNGSTTPGRPSSVANAGPSAPAGSPTTHPTPHTGQSAPALLLAAARTRLHNADPALKDGQFRYVRITSPAPDLVTYGRGTKPHTVQPPAGSYTLDQYWIPKDQTHVWMRRQSVVGDPDGGAPDVWKGRCDDLYADTQDGPTGPACTRPGTFEDPTPAFIAALPRDPDKLYAQLHAYAAGRLNPEKIHSADFEMFTTIDSLLDGGVVPSDLTSTLYGVLSRIPGIQVVDGTKNYAGVAGTGFRLSTRLGHGPHSLPDTQTIIVDLDSGAYLGDQDRSKGNHYASAVTTGVADRIGQPGH